MHQSDMVGTDGAAPAKRAPAIWLFIALDCTSFGVFFLVFMVQRLGQPVLFDQSSQHLDAGLGFLNACILITSSWLVAWANIAGREGRIDHARRLLLAGMAVATCFGLVKTYEYYTKFAAGITVATNEFYTFYFALTGIHFIHYVGGMVILGVLAQGPSRYMPEAMAKASYARWLEGGSLFWHMVDLLWIFIFALLYLIGAR